MSKPSFNVFDSVRFVGAATALAGKVGRVVETSVAVDGDGVPESIVIEIDMPVRVRCMAREIEHLSPDREGIGPERRYPSRDVIFAGARMDALVRLDSLRRSLKFAVATSPTGMQAEAIRAQIEAAESDVALLERLLEDARARPIGFAGHRP